MGRRQDSQRGGKRQGNPPLTSLNPATGRLSDGTGKRFLCDSTPARDRLERRLRYFPKPATAVLWVRLAEGEGPVKGIAAAWRRIILVPHAQTSLPCPLARIMVAERADFIVLAFVHEDVTVRAIIFILCNPWSADIEKSHGHLLGSGSRAHAGTGLTGTPRLMKLDAELRPWVRRRMRALRNGPSGRRGRRVASPTSRANLRSTES